jgi:hypothetical protein
MDWTPVKLDHSVDERVKLNPELDAEMILCIAVAMGIGEMTYAKLVDLRGVIVDTWAHPDSEYQYSVEWDGIDDEFSYHEGELVTDGN